MAANPYTALIQKYFPQTEWQRAYNVMMGESGGNPKAVGDNYPIRGQTIPSYGLFQIRGLTGRPNPKILLDPEENVKYAAQMWKNQGWGPWTAARKLGYVGKPSPTPTQPQNQAPVTQQPQTIVPRSVYTPPISTNLQSSALWPVLQMPIPKPLASESNILPGLQRRGKSIPEAFYGAKI